MIKKYAIYSFITSAIMSIIPAFGGIYYNYYAINDTFIGKLLYPLENITNHKLQFILENIWWYYQYPYGYMVDKTCWFINNNLIIHDVLGISISDVAVSIGWFTGYNFYYNTVKYYVVLTIYYGLIIFAFSLITSRLLKYIKSLKGAV